MNKYKLMASLCKGKVLDIGFATAPNKYLKNAVGVDIQKVEKPINYESVHRVNLNLQKLPFKNEAFDSIILGDTIEHVENPSFVLRECNRVLKKGGKFIVSTPHANYYWTHLHNMFLFIKEHEIQEHLSNWPRRDFMILLLKNGFKCIKQYGLEMNFPIIHIRIPVKNFPFLSWVIIYECRKISEATNKITLTDKNSRVHLVENKEIGKL